MLLKKYLLIFSFVTITIIGLLYGVSPTWFYTTFSDATLPATVDQSHVLRAVMMLYIGLGGFWLYSAFSDKYRDAGVIVLAIFCASLVTGRIISVIIDGVPSPIFVLYIFMELSLVPVCIWLLRRED